MDIRFSLNRPAEFAAFSNFCLAMAAIPPSAFALSGNFDDLVGRFQTATEAGQATALQDLANQVADAEAQVAATEPVVEKKTRAKKEPPKADPAPEVKTAPAAETTKPAAITEAEVRNLIIDLLNDWSSAVPGDPDIRVTHLKPILATLGVEKIGLIPMARYGEVAGLVDASRAELAEYLSTNVDDAAEAADEGGAEE